VKPGWQISPNLWVRGMLTPRPLQERLEMLHFTGVGTLVCCVATADDELRRAWTGEYVHYPMSDGRALRPDLERFARGLSERAQHSPVMIHCRAGRNRSGLLAALVLRELEGISGQEALERVQAARPKSLYNQHFCAYLAQLPNANGKLTQPQRRWHNMSEQRDLLEEMRAGGLVDDEADAPELTTTEAGEAPPDDQLEIQPAEADGRTWSGAEQLRPYLVRISDLKPTPGNPFKGKTHVGRLKGSLQRFGQTRPILTDAADGGQTIRAGHHLTLAAEDLGWTHVAAVMAEFSDEGEAVAYLMADNQLARVGDEDVDVQAQLSFLNLIGEQNLEGTGWDIDAVETLRAEAGATPVVVEQEPWGGEAAETAEEASARAAALAGYEPHKEIPLYMTLPQHELFSEHVRLLQSAWGLKGVMDTILRALHECYDREAAPVPDELKQLPPEKAAEAVGGDVIYDGDEPVGFTIPKPSGEEAAVAAAPAPEGAPTPVSEAPASPEDDIPL
jgi:hypothetical protein